MDVYDQEPEIRLLSKIIPLLDHRSAIDVGAERGVFVEALLDAGATEIHAIEPEPRNLTALRRRFDNDSRVTVHDVAASNTDGAVTLRLSHHPSGAVVTFGHTILERPDTDEIEWDGSLQVQARSLGSLVENEEIPSRIGILKVDTEGHDLAVVNGMGALDCDLIMVEHWLELPHSLGPCPWSIEQMTDAVSELGFSHFAFIAHRGELDVLQWEDATLPIGSMGNLVFLHDRILDRVLPTVLECASALAVRAADVAEARGVIAAERLTVIDELKFDRDVQAKAAAERLDALEKMDAQRTGEPPR